ncbi:transmembrane protein [Perilla frutescens var. hirtella]|uniref:Transmembrane protein n=1 Tax=Perilla frutescens var. hirtella TaxID=608512 RepID=A0AAD4IQ77_PERFH|nr:transmembrane protein [Perilla frutescens var. hirtella]KAH6782379.1 transmembrane protein [Perilla frutescens var. frutescens]
MADSGDGGAESSSADAAANCTCGSNNCSECCRRRSSSSSLPSSSSSCSLLSFDSYPVQDYNKPWRVYTASVKGFAIGAGLKGGLAIFALLTRLRRRQLLPSSKKVEMTSASADLIMALKETLRYGLFLGTFAGTFVSVDEIIAALGGHRRTAKWRALLAGAIAGPSMLLTGLNTQHTSLAIYILMRATVLASRCGIKSKRFGRICKPLTWAHGDIFLMCLSSSQILSAYILKQDSLPQSYKSFLNKHGAKDPVILNGVREIACGLPFTNLEAIEKFYKSNGVDIKLDPQMKIPCSIIHGNQACGSHFFSFLLQAFKRAVPVYLPVYLIPALIVHRQGLLKRPHTILWKGLLGTARSSLFLSMYCSSAWIWTCIMFRILKRCNIPMVAIGTFPTGLALAIEKKSRRIEISLYCFARAIESFFTCMADAGYLSRSKNFKRADVLVFSISTAIIMHCYAMERDVFRSKYLNVLDWVFGVPLPPYDTTPRKRR